MLKAVNIDETRRAERRAATRLVDSILHKRSDRDWTDATIRSVVDDIVADRLSEAQTSAWLATIACKGLTGREVAALTDAYASSGSRMSVRSADGTVADKHSTGGVGDKTTLIVAPIVASCGVPFAKLSGRGLGFAGGTIDKLETIPGLALDLDPARLRRVLGDANMVIACQNDRLAPGDAATYGLRSLTGSVESVTLIAASILSKKFALQPDALVLDVKFGRGALTPDREVATTLARLMVSVASQRGIAATALITDMDMPLGRSVGNTLEVLEAVNVLKDAPPSRLRELAVQLSAELLLSSGAAPSSATAAELALSALESGRAYETFLRWIDAQGGQRSYVERLAETVASGPRTAVQAVEDGYVSDIDPVAIGNAATDLGAGVRTANDRIDPSAGIELHARFGQWVGKGETIATIHGRACHASAVDAVRGAFRLRPVVPAAPAPVVAERVAADAGFDPSERFL